MPIPGARQTKITIYDVAREAGVSASTVSRTFTRPGRVSYQTAEHIRGVAARLGYRSHEIKPYERSGRESTQTLALVVADIGNPVFLDMIRGVEEEASRNNYLTILVHTRESAPVEQEMVTGLLDLVDGVVLSSSRLSDSAIRTIAKQKPTMVLNRGVTGVPCVVTDNARGMRRVLEHLGELGHTKICYLGGPESSWANGMRWRALKEAAFELGLNVVIVPCEEPTLNGGAAVLESVLETGATAVVGYNDQVAAGFLREAQENGIHIPRDLSVVGFDNSVVAGLTQPAMTTVASPLHQLGIRAVRGLLRLDRHDDFDPLRPVVVPTKLMIQQSTAPPKA